MYCLLIVDLVCSVKRKRSTNTTAKGTGEKQNKGLRHFSQLVCEKVREKGVTTYNEVLKIDNSLK